MLGAFDADGDGKMDFNEFMALNKKYPQMLHPAFRIQDAIAQNTLGRNWWLNKKSVFAEERKAKAVSGEKEEERKKARVVEQQKKQVMRKMGVVQYYLNCAKRKKYLSRIQAIEEDDEEREKSKLNDKKKKEAELARLAAERKARNRKARDGAGDMPGQTARGQILDLYGGGGDSSPKKSKKKSKKSKYVTEDDPYESPKKKKQRKDKKKEKKKKKRKDR